jgi:phage terminase Nu1 subunit (DNA packaging protein)
VSDVVSLPTGRGRTFGDERKRWMRARARREENRARRESGELVRLIDAERVYGARVVTARTRLLGVPSQLQQRFPELEAGVYAEIDRLIREALDELAGGARPDDDDNGS